MRCGFPVIFCWEIHNECPAQIPVQIRPAGEDFIPSATVRIVPEHLRKPYLKFLGQPFPHNPDTVYRIDKGLCFRIKQVSGSYNYVHSLFQQIPAQARRADKEPFTEPIHFRICYLAFRRCVSYIVFPRIDSPAVFDKALMFVVIAGHDNTVRWFLPPFQAPLLNFFGYVHIVAMVYIPVSLRGIRRVEKDSDDSFTVLPVPVADSFPVSANHLHISESAVKCVHPFVNSPRTACPSIICQMRSRSR